MRDFLRQDKRRRAPANWWCQPAPLPRVKPKEKLLVLGSQTITAACKPCAPLAHHLSLAPVSTSSASAPASTHSEQTVVTHGVGPAASAELPVSTRFDAGGAVDRRKPSR